MTIKTTEILEEKRRIGEEAFLWVHTSGDVILWPNEKDSENDSGEKAVKRWQINEETLNELILSGKIDLMD